MIRWLLLVVVVACGPGARGGPTMHNKIGDDTKVDPVSPVVSSDILARDPVANNATIEHILIEWKDSADDERRDPRAAKRTKRDAEDLVRDLLGKLKAGADFEALMKQYSEDPGSASGRTYDVAPDAPLVIEFKQLGLRLRIGEIGVVQSEYGFHIMKRLR